MKDYMRHEAETVDTTNTTSPTKAKKPIYKKWWFWVLVLIFIGACGSSTSNTSSTTISTSAPTKSITQPVSYTSYNVTKLFDDLDENALRAQQAHKGEYVKITGYLSNIDSDGTYISVGANPNDYQYFLDNILCYIKSDDQLNTVMSFNSGDKVVVKGKITDVGEVLGYYLNIDSVEKG